MGIPISCLFRGIRVIKRCTLYIYKYENCDAACMQCNECIDSLSMVSDVAVLIKNWKHRKGSSIHAIEI